MYVWFIALFNGVSSCSLIMLTSTLLESRKTMVMFTLSFSFAIFLPWEDHIRNNKQELYSRRIPSLPASCGGVRSLYVELAWKRIKRSKSRIFSRLFRRAISRNQARRAQCRLCTRRDENCVARSKSLDIFGLGNSIKRFCRIYKAGDWLLQLASQRANDGARFQAFRNIVTTKESRSPE